MQLNQVFCKRQTEAEAAVPSGARCVGLPEAVKDIRQEIRADAFACVAHGDANVWVHTCQARFDAPPLRRALSRTATHVPPHFPPPPPPAGPLPSSPGALSPP